MRKGQVWMQIHSGSTADRCTELKSVFYPLLEDISLLATLKFEYKKVYLLLCSGKERTKFSVDLPRYNMNSKVTQKTLR